MRPSKQGYGGHESETPSSHLWVGNLQFNVTEPELMDLFGKHGVIDGITCYASRSYAFVYFKHVDDAVAAKDALQGFLLNGHNLKIEFAKPAKPSKHVWVGGFGSSVTREKLEEELSKFGKIEDFKFIRDRNTALVDFVALEDAAAAVKNLNGLRIGEDRVRVDFLRSHPARREQADFHELGGGHFKGAGGFDPSWSNPDTMRNFPEPTYSGHKRSQQASQSAGGRKGGIPSKILWIGYPPSVVINEDMLHNAMILHGEIEKIKCFHGRNYSFVEFRSVEEARRAKEALQGKLFNDPRISIMFSNSGLAPGKDLGPQAPGYGEQRSDMYGNEGPCRLPLVDMFPRNRPMGPNNFHGHPAPFTMHGPGMSRPFGIKGNSDPLLPTPGFHDPSGLLPSPALPERTLYKTSGWDVLDPNHLPRETKRSRIDGSASFHDPSVPTAKVDEFVGDVDQPYGAGPQYLGGPLTRLHADNRVSPRNMGVPIGHAHARGSEDYIWRGVIAKGGTPVCHARCIPIGKGLEFELPEVVNCSARTGLDMLAKHHAAAVGFDTVFFLPDSEDDFANYTEFLRYLGSKNRAGVARLDDGTTLFLVPPSDFLTDVLKISGRERLYGVVLKLPQQFPGAPGSQQSQHSLPPVQQMDRYLAPPTHEYVFPKQDMAVSMEYGMSTLDESVMPPKAAYPATQVAQTESIDAIPMTSRPAVALTPELIATLQSILPASQTAVPQSGQPQVSSSTTGFSIPVLTNEKGVYSQGWSQPTQSPQVFDQNGLSFQQFGGQPYPPLTNTFQSIPSNLNVSSHPVPLAPDNVAMKNSVLGIQEQGSVPFRPAAHPVTPQAQQFGQGAQPYPMDAPQNTQKNYGMAYGPPTGSNNVAEGQQPNIAGSYTNPIHGTNISHPEMILPRSTVNVKAESLNAAERLAPAPSAVGLSTSEVEVDKNQRYQSTLQFAANLLLQIQQQQQQANSHIGNQQ